MPPLTKPQQLALKRLSDADNEFRHMKLALDRIVRAEVKERLRQARDMRDHLAYAAHQAGLTPTIIAREGLHTTNRSSAYEAISNGETLLPHPGQERPADVGVACFPHGRGATDEC